MSIYRRPASRNSVFPSLLDNRPSTSNTKKFLHDYTFTIIFVLVKMNREWRKKERDKKEKYIYTFRTFRFNGVQPPGNILLSHDEFLLVVYFTRDATSATSASIFNWLLTLFKYTRWRVCRGATYGKHPM